MLGIVKLNPQESWQDYWRWQVHARLCPEKKCGYWAYSCYVGCRRFLTFSEAIRYRFSKTWRTLSVRPMVKSDA